MLIRSSLGLWRKSNGQLGSSNTGNGGGGDTGGGDTGGGDTDNTPQWSPSDKLIRQVYFNDATSKFIIINNDGVEIKELAPNIKNQSYFMAYDDKIGFLSTKDGLYKSADGWNVFNKIYTIPELENYDVYSSSAYNYGLKNVLPYTVTYIRKTSASLDLPTLIYKYYRVDIESSQVREIAPEIQNKSNTLMPLDDKTAFISTLDGIYQSTGGWNVFNKIYTIPQLENYDVYSSYAYNYNLKNVLPYTVTYIRKISASKDLPSTIYKYYRVDIESSQVREVAPEIQNKSSTLMPLDDKTAFISTTDGLYKSTDGWNVFKQIFNIPQLENYNINISHINVSDYTENAVLSYRVYYSIKSQPTNLPLQIIKYYESYDMGLTWKNIEYHNSSFTYPYRIYFYK